MWLFRKTITGTIIDVLHSPHPYPNDVLDPALHIAVKKIEEKHILNTFYIFSTFISINLNFFCKRFIFCICVEEIHFVILTLDPANLIEMFWSVLRRDILMRYSNSMRSTVAILVRH